MTTALELQENSSHLEGVNNNNLEAICNSNNNFTTMTNSSGTRFMTHSIIGMMTQMMIIGIIVLTMMTTMDIKTHLKMITMLRKRIILLISNLKLKSCLKRTVALSRIPLVLSPQQINLVVGWTNQEIQSADQGVVTRFNMTIITELSRNNFITRIIKNFNGGLMM